MNGGGLDNPSAITLEAQLIESAFKHLIDGLIIVNPDARAAYWNPRAEEFLQIPASEMLGQRADEMIQRIAAQTTMPETIRRQLQSAIDSPAADVAIEMQIASEPMRNLSVRVFPFADLMSSRGY